MSEDKKFDLTSKVAIVNKDGKGATATLQTHPTFRTISQQQMRVVTMPVQTSGTQIIQTHLMPQAMIKQVDTSGRTQITALPRTISQASITVSRPVTPTSYHMPRGPTTVTNIQAPRGAITAPLRTPTPPASVTNITPTFVRTTGSPRSSTTGQTILSQGTTWMSGNPVQVQVPAQLIRANITQSPRPARVVTQAIPQVTGTGSTLTASVVTAQQPTIQPNQNNQSGGGGGVGQPNQQTFVATLALPRQPTAALVYSTNTQQQYAQNTQRLAVAANTLTPQRQVRPIQRLPTAGIRVTAANLSIRTPSVPVLAATIPSGAQTRTTTVSTTNLAAHTIPARIIPSNQAQMINASRLQAANVMTLQPIIVNNNRIAAHTVKQPSLTIAHVGKIATATPVSSSTSSVGGNSAATITVTNLSQAAGQQSQQGIGQPLTLINQSQIQQAQGAQQQQIAQLVSVNQSSSQPQIVTVSQHQLLSNATPMTITSRTNLQTAARPITTASSANISSVLPLAKVLPQQHGADSSSQSTIQIQQQQQPSGGQNQQNTPVFIHTRPPSIGQSAAQQNVQQATVVSSAPATVLANSGNTTFISQAAFYEHLSSSHSSTVSTTSSIVTPIFSLASASNAAAASKTNIVTSGTNQVITSNVYQPQASSFAVVPTSGGKPIGQIHGVITTSTSTSAAQNTSQSQPTPMRFNPQLLVAEAGSSGAQIIAMGPNSNTVQQQQTVVATPVSQVQATPSSQMILPIGSAGKPSSSPRPIAASILRKRESTSPPTPNAAVKNLTSALLEISGSGGQHESKGVSRPQSPPSRPPSSDGSTTVSATSSPTLDQQEQEEMAAMAAYGNNVASSGKINDMFPPQAPRGAHSTQMQHQNSTSSSSNGNLEPVPRKKPRRQHLPNENLNPAENYQATSVATNHKLVNNVHHVKDGQNETTVKKPQTVSLLQCYKQSWKAAANHFQRYSDVRPREERRPTIMDLANQSNITQKINGWKIYHLCSQIEDLSELESQVYEKLSSTLESMEAHNPSPDIDRVSELLKANMQRSRIIIDGINDARGQILKVFEHKTNVADIINRCASKRNFKKREKP